MLNNGLYIVSTPIGNLKDMTIRALETLQNADIIACEDTRVSKKLFTLLEIDKNKPFICYEDHREESVAQKLVEEIKSGKSVALISDAGSPLISDPGYKLVRLCKKEGVPCFCCPGVTAAICALQLSGLPTNRFMFLGFIPNKQKSRFDLFNEVKNISSTLVFYETAPRLVESLEAMKDIFEKREISIARELTKIHEESINGTAPELIEYYIKNPPKGEIVIVVEPPYKDQNEIDIISELKKRLPLMSLKQASTEVAFLSGKKKNEIYAIGLELKK